MMRSLSRSLLDLPIIFFKRSALLLPAATASTAATSSQCPPSASTSILTDPELVEIRHLLPALCDSGHSLDAVRLLDAALLADPPLSALPLPEVADRLASLPDMSASMALLTALRHNPRRPSPLPFCSLLLSSYFSRRRLREAAKVFAWLCRADSPYRPDTEIYRMTVRGFCERGRSLEAVRVAREMVADGLVPAEDLRVLLCQGLLREARVQEALDLESAIKIALEDDVYGIDALAELLDRTIRDWEV